jgi:hypothetical protein
MRVYPWATQSRCRLKQLEVTSGSLLALVALNVVEIFA